MITLRSKLQSILLWMTDGDGESADLKTFWAEQVREAARDRQPDDHYSKKYMREVRKRIISGGKPAKPLVDARPMLAVFAEEVLRRRQG